MKESLFRGRLTRRLLAGVLMLAMVVTLLPGVSMTAKADLYGGSAPVVPSEGITGKYPFTLAGSDTSGNMTLVAPFESEVGYTWYALDSSNGTPGDDNKISDVTSAELSITSDDIATYNQKWIVVKSGSQTSNPVFIFNLNPDINDTINIDGSTLKFTDPTINRHVEESAWYLSDGTSSYSYVKKDDEIYLDVLGRFKKGDTEYLLSTVYDGDGWFLMGSEDGASEDGKSNKVNENIKGIYGAFKTENGKRVLDITALTDDKYFAISADTQLGDENTSGDFYDQAALLTDLTGDKINYIALIGDEKAENPAPGTPAMKIVPITAVDKFWVGFFGNRKAFDFNIISEQESGHKTTTYKNKEVVYELEGVDSGLTMSWAVPENKMVTFRISAGDVSDIHDDGDNQPIIPIIPPATPEISVDGDGSIDVNGTISGETVTVDEITKSDLDKIINNNSKETAITIDVSANDGVTSAALTKTSAETIAEVLADKTNNKSEFVIKTTTAEVIIDATALSSIAKQAKGNEIELVVENKSQGALNASQQGQLNGKVVEKTFEAYFVSGGSRISSFDGGKVTIGKIDFTVPVGKNPKNYHVEYLPESGKAQRHITWYKDGTLFFDTTHFSDYAIVYDDSSENGAPGAAEKAKYKLALDKKLKGSQTGNKINVSWGKVSDADEYVIYAAYCGKTIKKVKTITNPDTVSYKISKLNGKAIDTKKNYKVVVKAFKTIGKEKIEIAKSLVIHIAGSKNAYTNAKAISLEKTKVNLNVGKTAKIAAKTKLENPGKRLLPESHAKEFRYASNNKAVATVNSKGQITAKKAGTATIYVYAVNGYAKSVKVTVK